MSVCVHSGRSYTSAAAEFAEFRKITSFFKNTKYLINTLYMQVYMILNLTYLNLSRKLLGEMSNIQYKLISGFLCHISSFDGLTCCCRLAAVFPSFSAVLFASCVHYVSQQLFSSCLILSPHSHVWFWSLQLSFFAVHSAAKNGTVNMLQIAAVSSFSNQQHLLRSC